MHSHSNQFACIPVPHREFPLGHIGSGQGRGLSRWTKVLKLILHHMFGAVVGAISPEHVVRLLKSYLIRRAEVSRTLHTRSDAWRCYSVCVLYANYMEALLLLSPPYQQALAAVAAGYGLEAAVVMG